MHSGLLISLSLVGVTWFFLSVEFDMIKQHITYTPCGCLEFRCAGVLICPDKLCSFPGKVCISQTAITSGGTPNHRTACCHGNVALFCRKTVTNIDLINHPN